MHGMQAREGNLVQDCIKGFAKGSSIKNYGDFHSQCNETRNVLHPLDALESVEKKNIVDCEVSRMINAIRRPPNLLQRGVVRIYTQIDLLLNKT